MRIRKLELQGFKSFVDRQTFHFGSGIAGLVGPNGCGKSNIVDAVKWCIGEQSAKSLRGSAMQDVIFNGSVSRPPVGMAEVSLTFVAADEPFPGQWARFEEISITRRLFRDGASEYRINRERVRLRDVQDLFMDTGVGSRLYSFIEQGQVDRIVLSSPDQRRALIEEAAGISRYKARRSEALDKLDQTAANLERVSQIADEMKRRLRSLERQVEKAARYRRLRATVRQGELLLGLARYAGLSADRRALVADYRQATAAVDVLVRTLASKEQGLSGLRDQLAVAETVAGKLRDRFAELEAQRRESESARHYQAKERKELVDGLSRLESELAEWTAQETEAAQEAERLSQDLSLWQTTVAGQQSAAAQAETRARQARQSLSEARAAVERDKRASTQLLTEVIGLRAGLSANVRSQEELADRRARADKGKSASFSVLDVLREALGGAQAGLNLADGATRDSTVARDKSRLALQVARQAVREGDGELRDLARNRLDAERTVAKLEARHASLSELLDAHEGVDEGARDLLEMSGVLGTLAEHLHVEDHQLELLQSALGHALEYVIVEDQASLVAAGRAVRSRVALIPISGDFPVGEIAALFGGTSAGRAAMALLLAQWKRAPDLSSALQVHRSTGCPVVADDGSRIDPQGVVWVGTAGRSTGHVILDRRRKLTALSERLGVRKLALAQAQRQIDTAEEAQRALRTLETEAVEHADTADGTWRRAQLNQAGARQRLGLKTQELRQAEGRARELAQETDRLDASAARLAGDAAQSRLRLSQVEVDLSTAESALRVLQGGLQEHEETATQAGEALAAVRAERDGGRRQVQMLQESSAACRLRHQEAGRRLARAAQDTATSQSRIGELGAEDRTLGQRIESLGHEQGLMRTRLDEEIKRLDKDREKLRLAEEGLRGLRDRREKASTKSTRLDLKLQEVRLQVEAIKEQVQSRYEISLPAMLDRLEQSAGLIIEAGQAARQELPEGLDDLPEAADLRVTAALLEDRDRIEAWVSRLESARQRLRKLGEVNLTALEEYQEIQERWTWLEEQRDDLAGSTESIRRAIADINRTCRARFRDTFDAVDQAFRTLYPRLVGGGEARLVLTDEDDLLETGVEIYARPPGKRLQSLRLLSGGEKAMTAIGLIFAIFSVKPSPFCILDEVDAALDEGNGIRFNRMLREMSGLSQFIVVTHSKKTMEAVDTLYGVTMPEPGSSRLVTVRIA
jgi:chromosome segregation protein